VFERVALAGTLGFVAALAIGFPALVLSAGGDGWNAPIQAALGTLVVLPLLGASWANRHREIGKGLAILVVGAAILLDFWVVSATTSEVRYFHSALRGARSLVTLWVVLWLLWQVAAIVHLLQFRQADDGPDDGAAE
jgi:uncharacterized membrane protein